MTSNIAEASNYAIDLLTIAGASVYQCLLEFSILLSVYQIFPGSCFNLYYLVTMA